MTERPVQQHTPRAGTPGDFIVSPPATEVIPAAWEERPVPAAGLATNPEPPPVALRAETRGTAKLDPTERVACAVYCNGGMVANGLIALGSLKRVAPQIRPVMFTARPQDYLWVKGIDVVEADEPLRSAHIDVDAWSGRYPEIVGHYYRKVAMWQYMLEEGGGRADWHLFIDADVLFLRCVQPMLRHVSGHRFAAMVEHWHPHVWSVLPRKQPALYRQVDLLFHGQAAPARMRRRPYFNSGVLLAREDEDVVSAVKDVLAASVLYPELTRTVPFSEQTLLNIATMARRVACRDLYGMCVPSYHDERHGWPEPVIRHFLSDRPHRHPPALYARYPDLVEASLAAIGTSVGEMRERGLFSASAEAPVATHTIESIPRFEKTIGG